MVDPCRGLFITGTDTGCGKTAFTAALAALWRQQGRRFRVCKPVATGSLDDTRQLSEAAGDSDLSAITPWLFPEPAAPPVAARAAKACLSFDDIISAIERRARIDGVVLVEGVGGLLCPLTEDALVADLIARLGFPMILVARRSLGTINHTLLTVEVARARRLPVAGVVISETTAPTSLAEQTAVEEIARRIPLPILAVMPYGEGETRRAALDRVDWWSLIGPTIQQPQ